VRCIVAQARRVRQLKRHQAWLQRNINSRLVQAKRHHALLMLRTELCVRLGCAGCAVEAALKLRDELGSTKAKSEPEGSLPQ
jgi:hypothetical protein